MCEIFELWLQKLKNENLRTHVLKALNNLPSPDELSLQINVQFIIIYNSLARYIEKINLACLRTLKLFT